MATDLYHVRPNEDWVAEAGAVLSATSEQTDYEAANAASDHPAEPWWADSDTATLTVTLAGAREIGVLALIATNAGDGKTITVGGGLSGTLTGVREISGYPRDLMLIFDPAVTASSFTLAITSNTTKWSIGRVVAGKLRSVENLLMDGFNVLPWRSQIIDPGIPDYTDDIIYDVGVEHLKIAGNVLVNQDDYDDLQDWYSSTKMGVLPTLAILDANRYPPMFARMKKDQADSVEGNFRVPLTFTTIGRGIEVIA